MLDHRRKTARLGIAVATAGLGVLLPSLVALPASASGSGSTARVAFEPLGHSGAGAAGACLLYRMVAQDAAFEDSITAPGQAFANVTLTETGDVETQDVDFCTVDGSGDDFKRAPRYFNSGASGSGTPLYYNPSWTLTPEESGNPTKARQDVPPATTSAPLGRPDKSAKEPSTSSAGANNYLNHDQAIVGFDREAGGFVFGVVAMTDGRAELSGYLDHNGDGLRSAEIPTVSPADVDAAPSAVSFTPGGPPYSLAVADAVRVLEATPKSVTAIAGDPAGASLLATVRNAEGQPLAGVRPRLGAEGGPNTAGTTPSWTGSCAASDGAGRAACTYSGKAPGTDQVAVFVNQTTSGGTAQRDAGEPFDMVEVTLGAATAASPAASPAATASPAPTALPTAEPTTAASAEPSTAPTAEPSEPAESRCLGTSTSLEREVITATTATGVLVRSTPGRVLRLLAYSRPSTTYRVLAETVADADGTARFTVRPLTNTRLYAQEDGCAPSASKVLLVRSAVTLGATRVGVRDVVFRGRAVPARTGQLVSLYRTAADGRQVLTGQARADAGGSWALRRAFSGTGRFAFVARTGADLVNAAGASSPRVVEVR